MTEPIIAVTGLGKRYRIRHQHSGARYVALRDVIAQTVSAPFRRRGSAVESEEDFWALRDVSFDVASGEVLGIIGRNGAGKSTLLKVLSRITEPSEGRVVLGGRTVSLLEVGTGFHPELSGRDNIFLNGSILGMTRAEIVRKFDEIVGFAGVERFLDTPVKRYSSGMYVRLAFAVAAHLDPEILIIDEVLAVGDAEFQQKCLGKIGEVAGSGRTVLFVSHHMATIESLCRTGLLLDQGTVRVHGPVRDAIAAYAASVKVAARHGFGERTDRRGTGVVRFTGARIAGRDGKTHPAFVCGGDHLFELRMVNTTAAPVRALHVSVGIESAVGQRVATWSTTYAGGDFASAPAGEFAVRIHLPRLALLPGSYRYYLFATTHGEVADWLLPAGSFDVEPGDFYGTGQLPGARDGTFLVEHSIELVA
ncbi:MAG TPA: ABC transporter ATP-binding protein [Vicinamibacterales bacterium]|nr:ABC transporter ATP-binding protein [Vicinamibacterales bacterium]